MSSNFLTFFKGHKIKRVSTAQENLGEAPTPIVLQEFIDIDWDARGWYAIGHHQPKQFLVAVAQHESPELLQEKYVEKLWAKIEGHWMEWFYEPVADTQPITLIILLESF